MKGKWKAKTLEVDGCADDRPSTPTKARNIDYRGEFYITFYFRGGKTLTLWIGQNLNLCLPHAIIIAETSILLHPNHIDLGPLSEHGFITAE